MIGFQTFGKRLLCFMLAALSLTALILPVNAVLQPRAATETVPTSMIHSKATARSAPVGQMEDGTVVTVLDETKDFYKIDCIDMAGYIAKEQVKKDSKGNYVIRCRQTHADTRSMERVSLKQALQTRSSLISLAREQLGTRYVYGGMRPGGFDCSGLMYYLYGQHDVQLQRCADEQLRDGLIVSKDALQIGDLLFFREAGTPWLASHVGVYAGNGQMIHAGNGGIEYADLNKSYYEDYFLCARRVVNVSVADLDTLPSAGTRILSRSAGNGLRTAP